MFQPITEQGRKPIDMNDPIEKLIVESVRLGEVAARWRRGIMADGDEVYAAEYEDINAIEAKSEELWQEAKRLGKSGVTRKNYEDLANAFLQECIEDYEDLLSGSSEGPKKNFELIEDVLEHQMYVKIDLTEQLKRIARIYHNQFAPYIKKHSFEIVQQWEEFDKKGYDDEERVRFTKHRCPLCGGTLKPKYTRGKYRDGTYVIGCSGCKLYC